MARRTSPMGITPSFSPSMGSEKSPKASLMSASSCAVMLCSLASLDWRGCCCFAPAEPVAAVGGRRLGGWTRRCRRISSRLPSRVYCSKEYIYLLTMSTRTGCAVQN